MYNEAAVTQFCEKFNLKLIIRSHMVRNVINEEIRNKVF